jgi:hypothetical protein
LILRFQQDGAERVVAALTPAEVERVRGLFGDGCRPGKRLIADDLESITDLLEPVGAIGRAAVRFGGAGMFPVRALLLEKAPSTNWRLAWHQDRVIAVEERAEAPGFDRWTVKDGQIHVQPPQAIMDKLVTIRVHADDVDLNNAPLRILRGTHRLGRLSEQDVEQLAMSAEAYACVASAGDLWAYRTPIVHASAEQSAPTRRRVLQLDFANFELSGNLSWALQKPPRKVATLLPSAFTA